MDRVKVMFVSIIILFTVGAVIGTLLLGSKQNFYPDGLLIDVRTEQEYNYGHADGAINIPVNYIQSRISGVAPNKNAEINLYCKTGMRAKYAKDILMGMGYKKVANLQTLNNAKKLMNK